MRVYIYSIFLGNCCLFLVGLGPWPIQAWALAQAQDLPATLIPWKLGAIASVKTVAFH